MVLIQTIIGEHQPGALGLLCANRGSCDHTRGSRTSQEHRNRRFAASSTPGNETAFQHLREQTSDGTEQCPRCSLRPPYWAWPIYLSTSSTIGVAAIYPTWNEARQRRSEGLTAAEQKHMEEGISPTGYRTIDREAQTFARAFISSVQCRPKVVHGQQKDLRSWSARAPQSTRASDSQTRTRAPSCGEGQGSRPQGAVSGQTLLAALQRPHSSLNLSRTQPKPALSNVQFLQ